MSEVVGRRVQAQRLNKKGAEAVRSMAAGIRKTFRRKVYLQLFGKDNDIFTRSFAESNTTPIFETFMNTLWRNILS
jgi:hypothetical protein